MTDNNISLGLNEKIPGSEGVKTWSSYVVCPMLFGRNKLNYRKVKYYYALFPNTTCSYCVWYSVITVCFQKCKKYVDKDKQKEGCDCTADK